MIRVCICNVILARLTGHPCFIKCILYFSLSLPPYPTLNLNTIPACFTPQLSLNTRTLYNLTYMADVLLMKRKMKKKGAGGFFHFFHAFRPNFDFEQRNYIHLWLISSLVNFISG